MLPHDYVHEKGDLIRAFVPCDKRRAITGFISKWRPDVVIVCQGHIGVSICGLAAAVRTIAHVISYIPMAHTLREMTGKRNLTVHIVDALLSRAYKWPESYVTSNDCAADQLKRNHGVGGDRIHVIEYGPDLAQLKQVSRSAARAELGLGEEYLVGMISRIEFRQKGHDIVLDAIKRHGGLPGNARLLIVGDGPDAQRMKWYIEKNRLDGFVKVMPYCSDISALCCALDVLLMPSRYEGVPIVMLQAMYFGIPVMAADVDGIKSLLPEEWRFAPGFGDYFMKALERVRNGVKPELLERNKQYIIRTLNAARYKERVREFVFRISGITE